MSKAKGSKDRQVAWQIVEKRRNVHVVKFPARRESWALLLADVHWDNPKCERGLLTRHLDEARSREAAVVSAGDFFCAMQGKWDKRASKADVRPEHQADDYLDAIVGTAVDYLEPYRSNLALFGEGNHEQSIQKRHETNLTERLCARLRDRGSNVCRGGFGGWIRFECKEVNGRGAGSRTLFYHHGAGMDPAVTKGQIEWERMASWLDGTDLVLAGHIHHHNYTRTKRVTLDASDSIVKRTVHWLRAGTYKDCYADGAAGYHIERNRGPRSLGGWWVRFYTHNHNLRLEVVPTEE